MKKVSTYIWEYKWNFFIAIIGLFSAVTLDMLAPQLTRRVVDDVILGGNMQELKWLLLGFFILENSNTEHDKKDVFLAKISYNITDYGVVGSIGYRRKKNCEKL